MTVDGQPPMVDEQAIIVFLRQLDHALSDALHSDEQRRLRWLTAIHALVMAVLADPCISIRHSDRPPAASPSSTPDRSLRPAGYAPAAGSIRAANRQIRKLMFQQQRGAVECRSCRSGSGRVQPSQTV
jgi:hypothetical protein